MLPSSATGKRTIQVAAGTSHSRTYTPADPNNMPIVERMTRSRLDKLSASQVAKWRNESIKAIQYLSPRKSAREEVKPPPPPNNTEKTELQREPCPQCGRLSRAEPARTRPLCVRVPLSGRVAYCS